MIRVIEVLREVSEEEQHEVRHGWEQREFGHTHYNAHLGSNDEMNSCHGDQALQNPRFPRTGKCHFSLAATQR